MTRHTLEATKVPKILLSLAALGAHVCAVLAQAPPPTVDVSTEDDRIRVTDIASGRVLYDQRNLKVYSNRNTQTMIVPSLEVVPQSAGMDLVYTYTNNTAHTRPLADMRIGTLVMPESLLFQDTKMLGGQTTLVEPGNSPPITYTYPDNTYSPVWVFRDDEHAVGISLLYPLFEYKHDVQFRLRQAPQTEDATRGWYLDLRISTLEGDTTGRGWIDYPAFLAPGESRTYTVAVRFEQNPEEWIRTLLPYREHFRNIFGGVQYQRRTHAAMGYSTGTQATLSKDNPYGFRSEALRPDKHGFGPMVKQMLGAQGWPEILVVKPSGQYLTNRQWNFPFKMLTQLQTTPELQTAFSPDVGLASIPLNGRELSLWWGRSLQVAEEWDPREVHPLDPTSARDRRRAFDELDLARQLGATGIGLDAFSHDTVPVWTSYIWLREMINAYPEIRFYVEPLACDVLHTLAPTWYRGWDESEKVRSSEDIYRIKEPHMLADFLLPGHEILLAMRYQAFKRFGINLTQSRVHADAKRFASWGFRPLIYASQFDLQIPIRAGESWMQTIPDDLQIPREKWILSKDPYDNGETYSAETDRDEAESDDQPKDDDNQNYVVYRGGVVSRTAERASKPTHPTRISTRITTRVPAIPFNPSTDRISKPHLTPEELREAIRRAKAAREKSKEEKHHTDD